MRTEGQISKEVRREHPAFADILKFYAVTTWCGNCQTRNYAYVPKGTAKRGLRIVCDNCGCGIDL